MPAAPLCASEHLGDRVRRPEALTGVSDAIMSSSAWEVRKLWNVVPRRVKRSQEREKGGKIKKKESGRDDRCVVAMKTSKVVVVLYSFTAL